MPVLEFFKAAEAKGWVMDWTAWVALILERCQMVIIDNDSGFEGTTTVNARDARLGFLQCTVMPEQRDLTDAEIDDGIMDHELKKMM